MTLRLVHGTAVLAALTLAAPVALAADPPPPTGDQSPSYGGNSSSGDHTAPYLRASITTRHLTTLAHTGKLKLSLGTSEGAVVALSGKLTARASHVKSLKLSLKGTTLLFKSAGQKGGTLTLSASGRRQLKAFLSSAGKKATGKATVTGTGSDAAHNTRHLVKTVTLVR